MFRQAVFGAFALFAGSAALGETRNCEVPQFHTADNATVPGRMFVRTGKSCTVSMGMGIGGVQNAQMVKMPERGTVAVGAYRVIYTPHKGYTGTDRFVYSRENVDRWGRASTRTVDMTVTVLP